MIPIISIIVPIYNTEKYLERCILSILNQKFNDFECILVDDGSTDRSPDICDYFSKKDSRIKVIHKNNEGVSAARNDGIEKAKGKWLGFVDSDDWIEPNMYEQLYNDAIKKNVNLVICGFIKKKYKKIDRLMTANEAKCSLFERNGIGGYSCLRLIKKDYLKDIRFDPNVLYLEDTLFNYELLNNIDIVYWHNVPLYHYEENYNSVTHNLGYSNQKATALKMLKSIEKTETNKIIRKKISAAIINMSISAIVNSKKSEFEYIKILRSNIKTRMNVFVLSYDISLKNKILGLLILNNFTLNVCLLFKNYKSKKNTILIK